MPLVIDIFDTIGFDFFGEGITAKNIARALASDPETDAITVRINSPGGDVFEGHAIFNLLRGAGAPVHVEIHGIAASMASIIALAGDTVSMADNAMFMIHNPWSIEVGDAHDMRATADMLDKIKSTLVNVYVKKTGKTKAQVSKLMDAETWLTAKEAKAEGFVDTVTDSFGDKKEASAEAKGRIFATLSQFNNTPGQLLSTYANRHGQQLVAAHAKGAPPEPKPKGNNMDRAQLLALFGLSADASDDTIRAKARELLTPPSVDNMVPRADFDAVNAKLAVAQATIKEHAETEEKRFKAEAEATVANAVKAGKIPPESKDYHLDNASRDQKSLDAFKAYIGTAPVIVNDDQMKRAENRNGATDAGGVASLTAEEKAICARLGVTEEDYLAEKAEANKNPGAHMYGTHVG
jgi:ATP-dependent Clp endopeptidase proteolytic subunit ClpP